MFAEERSESLVKYNDLYQIDSRGVLRVFRIGVYHNSLSGYAVVSETGQVDGKKVPNIRTFSYFEKATLYANAQYEDKLDKDGYKPIPEREVGNTYNYLRTNFPFISNGDGHPLPMLAQPIKDKHYKKGIRFLQRKYDGVRCLTSTTLVSSPTGDNITLQFIQTSRGGKYYDFPHIKDDLYQIIANQKWEKEGLNEYWLSILRTGATIVFDGEIYKHGVPLADISGAARTKIESKLAISDFSWLEYHIYDILIIREDGELGQTTMNTRMGLLMSLQLQMLEANIVNSIKPVQTIRVLPNDSLIEMIKHYHDLWVAEGYEGLIARTEDDYYECGIRSHSLIKVKEFKEEEFEITGVTIDGSVGISSFIFILQTKDGKQFASRALGTHEQWTKYFNSPPIGKMATLRFLNYSVNNVPEKAVVKTIRDYE